MSNETPAQPSNPHANYMDQFVNELDVDGLNEELGYSEPGVEDVVEGVEKEEQAKRRQGRKSKQKAPVDEVEDDLSDDEYDDDELEAALDEDSEDEDYDDLSDLDPSEIEVTVKIDGEEKTVTVDELKDSYQLAETARTRLNQAHQMQQRVEDFIHLVQQPERTFDILQQLGVDIDALAEEHVVKRYELSKMSPQEKRAYEAEQKLKQYETKMQQEEARQQRDRERQLDEKFNNELRPQILGAMEQAGVPKNKTMYAHVLKTMEELGSRGYDVSPSQAVRLAKKELQSMVGSMFNSSESDEFDKILTKEQRLSAGKLRSKQAKNRGGRKGKRRREDLPSLSPVEKKAKKLGKEINSSDDFFKLI